MAQPPEVDLERLVFTATRWDLIAEAASGDPSPAARRRAARALDDLCRIYRVPILAYLRHRTGNTEDAEDLAQEFCATRISPEVLAQVNAAKGRFRSLLLIALKNFVRDLADRQSAEKRGGRIKFVPLDDEALSAQGEMPAADLCFDTSWAQTVVERALGRLKRQFVERDEPELYDLLLPFLDHKAERARIATLAQQLGLTHNTLEVRISRFRALFASFTRQELGATVRDRTEINTETRYLLDVLSRAG